MTNDKDSHVPIYVEQLGELLSQLDSTILTDNERVEILVEAYERMTSQPTQSEDKCVECNGNGYTEIIGGYQHTCEVCYGEGFLRQPTQSDALREAWQEYFEAKDELAELERNRDSTSRFDRALDKKSDAEDKARRALAALQEQSK